MLASFLLVFNKIMLESKYNFLVKTDFKTVVSTEMFKSNSLNKI